MKNEECRMKKALRARETRIGSALRSSFLILHSTFFISVSDGFALLVRHRQPVDCLCHCPGGAVSTHAVTIRDCEPEGVIYAAKPESLPADGSEVTIILNPQLEAR